MPLAPALFALFAFSSLARATDFTWTAAATSGFNSTSAWTTSTGATGDFPISSGATTNNIVGNTSIQTMQFNVSGTVNNFDITNVGTSFNINATANSILTVGGTFSVTASDGTVQLHNGTNGTGGTATLRLILANLDVESATLDAGLDTTKLANLSVSGNTKVASGATLNLNINQATYSLGNLDAEGTVNLNFSSKATTLTSATITQLRGSGVVQANSGPQANPMLLTVTNTTNDVFSGTLADGGVGSTLSLTKAGSGTQTLSGLNTYSGSTTVSAGTLLVSGGLSNSTAATVAGGATLGLGQAAGGASFLTQTVATLSTGTGGAESAIKLSLGTGGNDELVITGSWGLNGQPLALDLTTSGLVSGSSTLITWGSGGLTSLSQVDLSGSPGFSLGDFSIVGGDSLVYTSAVPEPATWALLGLGLSAAVWRRRRR